MRGTFERLAVCASLVAAMLLATSASAIVGVATAAENTQTGENNANSDQKGESTSGDAVAGQVVGGTGAGDTTINASNVSRDVDVRSGDAEADNGSDSTTGLVASSRETQEETHSSQDGTAFVDTLAFANTEATNEQDGDNDFSLDQTANASSGDGVAGQVIGVVTPAGGSADVVAANTSEDVDARTGDASSTNDSVAFTGLRAEPTADANASGTATAVTSGPFNTDFQRTAVDASAFADAFAFNTQTNDNDSSVSQSADANTGDGVGGQVIGLVAGGDTSVDAKNTSTGVDVTSGDATSANTSDSFTGLDAAPAAASTATGAARSTVTSINFGSTPEVEFLVEADVSATAIASSTNILDGENTSSVDQGAGADSGDAVGGQVIGAVTSAGGSADIVAANTSDDVDADTGEASSANDSLAFTGLNGAPDAAAEASGTAVLDQTVTSIDGNFIDADAISVAEATSDVTATVTNVQTDDNDLHVEQSSDATTGDAVGGEVIGLVSAGDSSVDASNTSTDVDVTTGEADAASSSDAFAGLDGAPSATGDATAATSIAASGTAFDAFIHTFPTATAFDTSTVVADVSNTQDGENNLALDQAASSSSGDAVGGQVIGAVTSAGGSADVVAANRSEDVDVTTGNADSLNMATATAGLSGIADARADSTATATVDQAARSFFEEEIGTFDAPSATVANEAGATATVDNEQTGDNDLDLSQSADASTGDGVGGQVIGLVSAGDTSVDASNTSEDVDVETGEAASTNDAHAFAGLEGDASGVATAVGTSSATSFASNTDIVIGISKPVASDTNIAQADARVSNEQLDDNQVSVDQSAGASSGDGVAGQVIGSVTSAGGSADVVAENRSEDVDVVTGRATAANDAVAQAGLAGDAVSAADAVSSATAVSSLSAIGAVAEGAPTATASSKAFSDSTVDNFQDGENAVDLSQSADAATGDGVGGQVIGLVSAGDTSVDAKNTSVDVDVETGAADSANAGDAFAGLDGEATSAASSLAASSATSIATSTDAEVLAQPVASSTDVADADSDVSNRQLDDNQVSVGQSADASSGDGVAGQVIGSVASAGGSADVAAENRSEDVDVVTGRATAANDAVAQAGLAGDAVSAADAVSSATAFSSTTAIDGILISRPSATAGSSVEVDANAHNFQDGENTLDVSQSADAPSGDGVGGQVIGLVSAGDTSVDANNTSEDVDIETGTADASNGSDAFVGLDADAEASGEATAAALAVSSVTHTPNAVFFPFIATPTANADANVTGGADADNEQTDDNAYDMSQSATAFSGDGVGGQVVGQVTPAGGTAKLVGTNRSTDADVRTGSGTFTNDDDAFVGLQVSGAFTGTTVSSDTALAATATPCISCIP